MSRNGEAENHQNNKTVRSCNSNNDDNNTNPTIIIEDNSNMVGPSSLEIAISMKQSDHQNNNHNIEKIGNESNHLETPASSSSATRKRTWSFWSRQKYDYSDEIDEDRQDIVNIETTKNNKDSITITSDDKSGPVVPKYGNPLANTYIPYDSKLDRKSLDLNLQNAVIETEEQEPNIVVPSFDILPCKSIWNTVADMIGSRNSNPQKYLYRMNPSSRLNRITNCGKKPLKILIVGVHGFFPTKVLRTFIGEPTGTSMKFINEAEEIVSSYFKDKKIPIEISRLSLEKEGEIFDRVDFFFDVMRRYSKEINESDFIYFVSHSQGCPVTIILLARLIETGIINIDNSKLFNNQNSDLNDINLFGNKKIITILGMAGINNGPFYGADQTLIVRAYQTIAKDAMMELFEFQKFDSIHTKKLVQSIKIIISNNIKITLVGSINDQLVPLYSSFCLFVDHANIFRATFVDKNSRTPAFITRIVKIAGTLINLGYRDHDIIKEISGSLAGPLTGGGHSTIYSEKQVYELGLKFALETTDTNSNVPVIYMPYKLSELGSNPYHLPWCMRGLLYETKRNLNTEEINTLYKEYEDWKPESKQLKDIRYRLNGLRYKL